MFIGKNIVTSMQQVDANDSQDTAADTYTNDPGFAPISPETPSFGPPSGTDESDPGFAPISPETPPFAPPSGSDENDPGFAPISPETPPFAPPSGSGGSTSGGGTTVTCPTCGSSWTWSPVVVIPGQNPSSGTGMSNVRFLYAATGQPPINIRLGNRVVINRMQFGNSTPYYLENSGYQTILVSNSNTGQILYRGIFFFGNGTAYTFAIINNGMGISLMQIVDTPCSSRNAACVRAVNLSPNSGAVDFFLSGTGRIFRNVDAFGVTGYQTIRQGAYRVSVSEALPCVNNNLVTMADTYVECGGTRIAVMDSLNVNFMSGVTYTLYLIGLAYQLPAAQILSLESDLVY